ncbi:hypothetical protein J3459_010497 [Metarhizium acridum]|nr:hypothetical protein J3459_010497 [Metarhizium acridum]
MTASRRRLRKRRATTGGAVSICGSESQCINSPILFLYGVMYYYIVSSWSEASLLDTTSGDCVGRDEWGCRRNAASTFDMMVERNGHTPLAAKIGGQNREA